jgi:twitching motility two-component system response regulator PilG
MQPWVMIIDDSNIVRKIVEVALKREGYRVKGFPDGIAALKWLMSPQAQVPALLFLDITLPKMDGFKIAHYLKQKPAFASMPIVMLTRRCGVIDLLKAKLAGANNYMTKPFTTQELVKIAQQYVGMPMQAEAVSSGRAL